MKTEYIKIRLTEKDKDTIRKASEDVQMTMSEYIIALVREAEVKKEIERTKA